MSAEVLREAAALMRDRAEAAIASLSDNTPAWHSVSALMGEGKTRGDAEHIAALTPTVALAVADWIDQTLANISIFGEPTDDDPLWRRPSPAAVLTVANDYLGGA